VDPYKPCCDVVLTEAELKVRRAENSALLEQAAVMMGHLLYFTEGTGFAFTLHDNKGYLLARTGDRESLELSDTMNLIEGAKWSENVMGTSAGTLAHILGKPVQLSGYEHFCRCSAFTTARRHPFMTMRKT
jgi:transcriptional regulator of acetoin/glycerol metabolism